jgi:WD40 repeat protein
VGPGAARHGFAPPDGKWIATDCTDRRTRNLDAATGTETFRVEGDGRVRDLAFTADSVLLATVNEDGTVILVDAPSGSERSRVTRLFACSRIALSFDGALLAAAWDDNTVSVFDLSTGESPPPKLRELPFTGPVSGLAFNPAEHTVAVATAGASVAVYDAREGSELIRILQPAPVSHFAFSADGALIATTASSGCGRADRNQRERISVFDRESFLAAVRRLYRIRSLRRRLRLPAAARLHRCNRRMERICLKTMATHFFRHPTS